MSDIQIRFDNGAAYEDYMGKWSQLAGERFIDWLAPASEARWLDVGCGNGAFTEMLVTRCAPAVVHGVDPSAEQLVFARQRPALAAAQLQTGDAMALPFADDAFDVAVMPLVIFFVPEPARGVAEMARVLAPGGTAAAYAWDMHGGGFPYNALRLAITGLGYSVPAPPSPEASRIEVLQTLWQAAGLTEVQTTAIEVERSYASFDDFWRIVLGGPSVGATLAAMAPADTDKLKAQLRTSLPTAGDGSITYSARAHAVKGRVPG
ncbi:methyltransferase domain-containing protein [Chitinivorax sp. PXF-14]|uniref:class I SAM-dependent methyltransferase n=1 Tax=Chitinivorax sp. PXF-14 TaxID=3230488 RepID=UPI0034651F86